MLTKSLPVPLVDLKQQYLNIKTEVLSAIAEVLESSQFVLGKEVAAFEDEFADYCNVRYAVATNTGTSALHLSLLSGGVGPREEVSFGRAKKRRNTTRECRH